MHAIALVPGFLGFDHDSHVTYFADRFLAALQANVEAETEQSVFVAPVVVPPIGSLAERQRALLAALTKLEQRQNRGPFTWHLIGHSTGGLDAAYLARTTKLVDGERGSVFSDEALTAPRLASVTTLSTPHYGTCLTRAELPAATAAGASARERLKLLAELPMFVGTTLRALVQRDALGDRLNFFEAAQAANSAHFFWHLLFADKLARDLDPAVAGALTAEVGNRRADVPIFSLATMAPAPAVPHPRDGDRLFETLWTWTQEKAAEVTPAPDVVADSTVPRIAAAPDKLPQSVIGPRENDGVVNTNRQVFGTFAGLVLGDHADVMGRYRRVDALDGTPLDPGLLTSTADFGDPEFFELLRRIADGISKTIRSS